MIATLPTASRTVTTTARTATSRTATLMDQGVADSRTRLQAEVLLHEQQAFEAVAVGDLDQAAKAILAALNCERRLAANGPQVLQLIKPRN
jgi:hypothetical protein